MTGYTVNTGSNEKFSAGWDRVFGGPAADAPKKAKRAAAAKPSDATKVAGKAPAKKRSR